MRWLEITEIWSPEVQNQSVDRALIPADNLEENMFHVSSDFFQQTAPLGLWQHSCVQGHDHPSSLLHVHIAFSLPQPFSYKDTCDGL